MLAKETAKGIWLTGSLSALVLNCTLSVSGRAYCTLSVSGNVTAHYQSVGRLLHISHHSSNWDPGNPQMLQLSATLAWIRVHTHLGQMQETHFGRFVCKPILAHQEELGSRLSAYPSETSCSQRLKTRDCSVIFSYINATIWHFAYVSLSLLVEESCFRKETPDL